MSSPAPAARTFRFQDIVPETKETHDYVISQEVYGHFLAAFDDRSPVHVEEDYAKGAGFSGRVMHGALLGGFLSHFVGMHFPGRSSLLLSMDLRFAQPSYLGDQLRLEAVVKQKMDVNNVIVLDVTFRNLTRDCLAARGRVQVSVRHET